MAYPTPPATAIPDVATDANYDAAGEDWHGTPTKVTPSMAVLAQGFVPGDLRIPMYDNFLFAWIRTWILYLVDYCDELLAQKVQGPATVADNILPRFSGTTGKVVEGTNISVADTTSALSYVAAVGTTIPVPFVAHATSSWTHDGALALQSTVDASELRVPVRVPLGAVITGARAMVDPGAIRAGANRMALQIQYRTVDWGAITAGTYAAASAFDNGSTSALQNIAITGQSISVAAGTHVYLVVFHGTDGGSNTDILRALEVTFDDPGPSARG
jgi:hypothetical protein